MDVIVPCYLCGDSGIEITGAPRSIREPDVCDCNKVKLKRRYYDGKFLILIPTHSEDSGTFFVGDTLFSTQADAERSAVGLVKENIANRGAVILKALCTIRPKT